MKTPHEFSCLELYIKGDTIIDVGCGTGALGSFCHDRGYKVLLTDVIDRRMREFRGLPFERMISPVEIPYRENSAQTVLLHYVLHHIDSSDLVSVLKELTRVSKRIIIREDVYQVPAEREKFKSVYERDKFLTTFSTLEPNRQLGFLLLWDYWINCIEKGISDMNYPFEFKTVSQWEDLFRSLGFENLDTRLIGFSRGRGFYGTCHVIFVLDAQAA